MDCCPQVPPWRRPSLKASSRGPPAYPCPGPWHTTIRCSLPFLPSHSSSNNSNSNSCRSQTSNSSNQRMHSRILQTSTLSPLTACQQVFYCRLMLLWIFHSQILCLNSNNGLISHISNNYFVRFGSSYTGIFCKAVVLIDFWKICLKLVFVLIPILLQIAHFYKIKVSKSQEYI